MPSSWSSSHSASLRLGRRWHATHAFEDFFSPPDLFIYSMHLCATITLAYIAYTPDLRRWFGSTFRLPIVPFPIPGAIGLAGAGFGVVQEPPGKSRGLVPYRRGFAFTTAAIWQGTPVRPLVGTPLFIVGSSIADAIWIVVAVPTRAGVIKLTTLAGIVIPALTGIVDLVLCVRIP